MTAIFVLFFLIIHSILLLITRKLARASNIAVALVAFTFAFGAFVDGISKCLTLVGMQSPNPNNLTIPYCVCTAFMAFFFVKTGESSFISKATRNIIFVFFTLTLITELCQTWAAEASASKAISMMAEQNENLMLENSGNAKPDIYYIILDAGASAKTLVDTYKMQDLEFFDYLKRRGFYIAESSLSNYDRTKFSLSSSLNLNYINCLSEFSQTQIGGNILFCRLIQKSQVFSLLKKIGYKIVHVKTGFPLTESNPEADLNAGSAFAQDFLIMILHRLTLLQAFENRDDLLHSLARDKRTWPFFNIDKIRRIPGPKFVFLHILLPHPPFLFNSRGGHLKMGRAYLEQNFSRETYVGQIVFTFKQTEEMLDRLILNPFTKTPVIILQSDHGPQLNWNKWPYSQAYLKERFSIINAYLMPGEKNNSLYQSISPVNTFRLIFNHYFNAHFALLPDNSYYAPIRPPYEWTKLDVKAQ